MTKKKNIYWSVVFFVLSGALSIGALVYALMWSISYVNLTEQYLLWSAIIAVLFGAFLNEFYFHLAYSSGLISQKTNEIKNTIGEQAIKEVVVQDIRGMSENDVYNDAYINNIKKLVRDVSETEEYKSIVNKLGTAINSKYPSDRVAVQLPNNPVDILFALRCNGFRADVIDNVLYVSLKY